jgi:hypothetical protein
MRGRAERSPDVHWPPYLSLRWSEMFAHNVIEINAPSARMWNCLVHAELWPQWVPPAGKVKINGRSQILETPSSAQNAATAAASFLLNALSNFILNARICWAVCARLNFARLSV